MDISALSLAELKQLQEKIPQEIKKREHAEKTAVLKELKSIAAAKGFSWGDLVGAEIEGKPVKFVAAKYRHPENPELAWSGRGRKPKWVETWLGQGRSLDELAV